MKLALTWGVPSIASIQRTNAILVVVTAALLAYLVSIDAAVGCTFGGAIVIANLFLLAMLGRVIVAAVGSEGRPAARFGVLALPLKLLLFIGLIYLVLRHASFSGIGFGLGILTQLLAVIIETGRASLRAVP